MSEAVGEKTTIAILGGGIGAMAAAFELTAEPGWRDRFEVTVYQMGWRLGGKGASGRNGHVCQRIEEHGLHFWLGFYENAFRMIRQCYQENARPLTVALAAWTEAFKPCNEVTVEDHVGDEWIPWILSFQPNGDLPGDTLALPTVWQMLGAATEFLSNLLVKSPVPPGTDQHNSSCRNRLLELVPTSAARAKADKKKVGVQILEAAQAHVRISHETGAHRDPRTHALLRDIVDTYQDWIRGLGLGASEQPENATPENEELRRFRILTEFGLVNIRGVIADGILLNGFSAIDEYDYIEWLQRHGASAEVTGCGIVRAFYDLFFSPGATISAGTFLKGLMRILFTYRGAVYWRMQAGMGDTIFAPFYEVLRRRGVTFRFFHKVKGLHLSADRTCVDRISMARQVHVKSDPYEPLVTVRRLPCWPSEPLYDQLAEGDDVRKRGINLESHWADWEDVESFTLVRGRDFDQVVFGISLGSVPVLCKELMDERLEWRNMVQHVETVPTQAFQLWFLPDIAGLGWPSWKNESPLVAAFVEPVDTFANMDQLLIREEWQGPRSPSTCAYFCGPMDDPGVPPPSDHGFPAAQTKAVYASALASLKDIAAHLLPATGKRGGGFDYSLLADPANGSGQARFDAQFFRANVDPSERYVRSAKGSTKYRLPAARSGFANLFLAGDWTDNGINAGCVEAAVISGKQAAAGILKRPSGAVGESFGEIRAEANTEAGSFDSGFARTAGLGARG